MTGKRKKADYAPHIEPQKAFMCHIQGCVEAGVYKAPRSKEQLNDYQWYCLEHIREHNKQWDFFEGMDSEQIESFMKDAVTGHRPTWERETHIKQHHVDMLQDAIHAFFHHAPRPDKKTPALNGKIRKALSVFELPYPYAMRDLKKRYRELVKQHHPDRHKGDKKAEERFKEVTVAYHALSDHIKNEKT